MRSLENSKMQGASLDYNQSPYDLFDVHREYIVAPRMARDLSAKRKSDTMSNPHSIRIEEFATEKLSKSKETSFRPSNPETTVFQA